MPTHDPCCDKTFVPGLCIMRHNAGKQKILRGMSEREKCATCPQIIEYLEEIKMTENKDDKTKPKCAKCDSEKIAARGLCGKHYKAQLNKNKAQPSNASAGQADAKSAQTETKTPGIETKPANSETKIDQNAAVGMPTNGFGYVFHVSSPLLSDRIRCLEIENEQLRLWVDRLTKAVAA